MADYGYGQWLIVAISIILFGSFLLALPYRRKSKLATASKGVLGAFVVALFAEMYGFPLTIYILSWLVGYQNPLTHESGHLLYPEAGMLSPFHFLSIIIIFGGLILVSKGWSKIYDAKGSLVTDGIYSYVRHPQYLGIFLVTSGFLLQWITIPTAIMFPILLVMYYRLSKSEEHEMKEQFGVEYVRYCSSVPLFIPKLHRAGLSPIVTSIQPTIDRR